MKRWLIAMATFALVAAACTAGGGDDTPSAVDTASGAFVFPDYPKIGVWPDAYYMGTQRGFPNGGLDVWAFDREPKPLPPATTRAPRARAPWT